MNLTDFLQLNREPVPVRQPGFPGLVRKIGYVPNFRERSASKKVDDLSRHESKHDTDPKHDPKLNAREKTHEGVKPGGTKPQVESTPPGMGKK
jgi:hypothetical protein